MREKSKRERERVGRKRKSGGEKVILKKMSYQTSSSKNERLRVRVKSLLVTTSIMILACMIVLCEFKMSE